MSAQFFIVAQTPDGEKPLDGYGPYDDGKAAAEMCKRLNTEERPRTGFKYEPRRMKQADPSVWKKREEKRIKSGHYKPLPPAWEALTKVEDHYLHISASNMNRVAYFPDDTAGTLDRPVETTAGRYLKAHYPHLNEEQVKDYIALIDNMTDVNFATTREEIAWVYQNGPDSCMAKKASHYNSDGVHPAEGYAAGDLAVAWLGKKGERVSARVVCHPGRKQYGTIYGDRARLQTALDKLGYSGVASFNPGIKMAKIPLKKDKYTFAMAFFDNFGAMVDKGDHFETVAVRGSNPDYEKSKETVFVTAGNSSGYCTQAKFCPKNRNLQGMDSEWRFVEGVNQEWSNSAWRSYAFECPGTKKLYPDDAKYYAIVRTGRYDQQKYSADWAKDNTFQCSVLNVRCLNKDLDASASTDDKKVSVLATAEARAKAEAEEKKKAEAAALALKKQQEEAAAAERAKARAIKAREEADAIKKAEAATRKMSSKASVKSAEGAAEQVRAATHRVHLNLGFTPTANSEDYAVPVNSTSNEEVYEGA